MMSKIKHIVWPQVILFGDSITQVSDSDNKGHHWLYLFIMDQKKKSVFMFTVFFPNKWMGRGHRRQTCQVNILLNFNRLKVVRGLWRSVLDCDKHHFIVTLVRKCDVVNRGLSGYNTRWAKILLPRLITSAVTSQIAAVTVFFGANDCALEGKDQNLRFWQ